MTNDIKIKKIVMTCGSDKLEQRITFYRVFECYVFLKSIIKSIIESSYKVSEFEM